MSRKILYCSFCGKSQDDVSKLIAGPAEVCICDQCAKLAIEIVQRSEEGEAEYGSWLMAFQ